MRWTHGTSLDHPARRGKNSNLRGIAMKTCSKCGLDENDVVFPQRHGRICNPCLAKGRRERYAAEPEWADKLKKRVVAFQKENPDSIRNTHLKRYGISLKKYEEMLVVQGGVCAICKGPPTGRGAASGVYYVDHDHVTGEVRELLCHGCNALLGYAKDDAEVMSRAAAYILKHGNRAK
jgi:hypothetical protein